MPETHLFIGERGPLTTNGVYWIVRKYARHADLEPIGPHVLRHTFATRYLAANSGDLVGLGVADAVGVAVGNEHAHGARPPSLLAGDRSSVKVSKLRDLCT